MLPEAELCWEQTAAQCCVGALVRSGTWGAVCVWIARLSITAVRQGARPLHGSLCLNSLGNSGRPAGPRACAGLGPRSSGSPSVCEAAGSACCQDFVSGSLDPGEANLPSSGLPFREPGGLTGEGQAAPLDRGSCPEVASRRGFLGDW